MYPSSGGLAGAVLIGSVPWLEGTAVSEGFIPGFPPGTPAGNQDPAVLVGQLDTLLPWLADPAYVTMDTARYSAFRRAFDVARMLADPVTSQGRTLADIWPVQDANYYGLDPNRVDVPTKEWYRRAFSRYLVTFYPMWQAVFANQVPVAPLPTYAGGLLFPMAPGELAALQNMWAGIPPYVPPSDPTAPVPPSMVRQDVEIILDDAVSRVDAAGQTVYPILALKADAVFSDGSVVPGPWGPNPNEATAAGAAAGQIILESDGTTASIGAGVTVQSVAFWSSLSSGARQTVADDFQNAGYPPPGTMVIQPAPAPPLDPTTPLPPVVIAPTDPNAAPLPPGTTAVLDPNTGDVVAADPGGVPILDANGDPIPVTATDPATGTPIIPAPGDVVTSVPPGPDPGVIQPQPAAAGLPGWAMLALAGAVLVGLSSRRRR